MRYLALATDYDGTLAHNGRVSPDTLAAVKRLRESGRRVLLVTGRELEDLFRVFPEYGIFDRIVAENGALVFNPETREETLVGEAPPPALVERLRERGVQPLSVGRIIVATWEPNEQTVLDTVRELGLEHQVIFNKGAVMLLPPGVNKAAGLAVALTELRISPHNVAAIGDAENDHALLAACEAAVAVENALPILKERADWVTATDHGAGVVELIDRLLENDLADLEPRLTRHEISLGTDERGETVSLHAYGHRVLLCGTSGSGKSTLALSFLERICEQGYQFAVVDPEGDFPVMPHVLVVGDDEKAPEPEEVAAVLQSGENSVIANLLGLPLERRPLFLGPLLARLGEERAHSGRPHWIVVDEAHHMMPEGEVTLPEPVTHPPLGLLLLTVHPDRIAKVVLRTLDTLLVVGDAPGDAIATFAEAIGVPAPPFIGEPLPTGAALLWRPGISPQTLVLFEAEPPKSERHRHQRKYATGELGEDKSFYFRGPEDKLNLRAQNLALFLQVGDGVDDDTWLHHLSRGDFSRWLREAIKNDEVAAEIAAVEEDKSFDAAESRKKVREAIEKVYTLPA